MKLSVMTLGCPAWDLETAVRRVAEYGYDGIDFRGIAEHLDVTRLPEFTTDVAATRRLLADHGLAVSGISSSIRVCDAGRRADAIEEAKRTIDAALAVGAENVRVFGEGRPDIDGYENAARVGVDCVREILALSDACRLRWNFETHDFWVRSDHCRLLLEAIDDPAFGVVWDVGHTRRVTGESPQQTLAAFGRRLHYVHLKDAKPADAPLATDNGWQYVLPGEGTLNLAAAVATLHDHEYGGWLVFEHEKRWHPELEEPEVAFPAFVKWARPLLNK